MTKGKQFVINIQNFFRIAAFILAAGCFLCHARFRQRSGYGTSKGVEQSRRENQFIRIGDGDYLQRRRQDRDFCVDP